MHSLSNYHPFYKPTITCTKNCPMQPRGYVKFLYINFQSVPEELGSAGELIRWLINCGQLDEATLADTAKQLTGLSDVQLRDLLLAATAAADNSICFDSKTKFLSTETSFNNCIMLSLNRRPRLLACRLRHWTDLVDDEASLEDVWHIVSNEQQAVSQNESNSQDSLACANPLHYTRRVWCTVSYYELDTRVGDAFRATEPYLRVDGGGGGGGRFDRFGRRRFCLAPLRNLDRPAAAYSVRRCIGQGVTLQLCRGGTILMQCRSPTPVFVQSPNASLQRGWHPTTVCRVPPGGSLCVFSDELFQRLLADCRTFEEAYSLIRMCSIRISFAKGWGSDYRRQRVTATPCWLEIVLAKPLVWLDRVLVSMRAP